MLEAGVAPFTAGWAEWPATLVDAVQVVLREVSVIREREAKRGS